MSHDNNMGISGRLAQRFLNSELTPLIAVALLLLGVFAVLVTPREEEPQIDVTMANVIIAFPGASAASVESLVASPMEQVLGEIEGVEHLYSISRTGTAVLTVQFKVGVPRNTALVRLYNAVYSNRDWRPEGLGVMEPIIKPKGIDDVPIVSLTLSSSDTAQGAYQGAYELKQVAHSIEAEIKRVPGTRNVYTVGGPDDVVHVLLEPARLAGFGMTAASLQSALEAANVVQSAGYLTRDNQSIPVQAGEFFARADEVANLIVGLNNSKPIYLQDVATVTRGPQQPQSYVKFGTGAANAKPIGDESPAVTIAIAKQPGRNAADVAEAVIQRVTALENTHIPANVDVTVTRNYGATANDKAQKLIQKLMFATVSVIVLVIVAVGWREAVTVGTAVIVTLAATLFASWAWGFTINRVSLFALIFSIGILVDDAIVVVENIHRHFNMGDDRSDGVVARAVDEVGGPTILATFTVIAALLPMAFVSGLMGPYMSPIPINASMGMLISLGVALIVTPWLSRKLLAGGGSHHTSAAVTRLEARIEHTFERALRPFLQGDTARKRRHRLYAGIGAAIVIACSLAVVKLVVLKMLPFDNKSEFQVVVNMSEGTALEQTAAVLDELAAEIRQLPEVTDYQIYAGTSAPINFNGLVRQYYLRSGPLVGDIQVNLTDKHHRSRKSHDIALAIRPALTAIARRHGAVVQVVEVPPGPPVQSPIVAEVYGPDYVAQRALALRVKAAFDATADIVDSDTSIEAPQQRHVLSVDRDKAALFGISQQQVVQTLYTALYGNDATYLRAGQERYPIPVRIELPMANKDSMDTLLALEVQASSGKRVPLSEFVQVKQVDWDSAIYHKDLLPVSYVMADMAGDIDSPLYGMFDIIGNIKDTLRDETLAQRFISQPESPNEFAIKWDGEWQITYETFRDMGLAYSVGLLLIYLLVVAQFKSYGVPLIIMAPIPLTVIGIMPGHALLGAQFTATSMIGMIALAGIIVRNSILLVDFINLQLATGQPLAEAVMQAAIVRTKPIVLTGLAAMMGGFFILDDPIFNGLAVSLIFGILVSTLLTLVVIPVLYFSYLSRVTKVIAEGK